MNYLILSFVLLSGPLNQAFGANSTCTKITLPNVLGLDECLGSTGNTCTSNNDNAMDALGNLFLCVLQGMGDLDDLTKVAVALQLLGVRSDTEIIGNVVKILKYLCKLVNANCEALNVNANIPCGNPIVLNVPSSLGIDECLGMNTQVCDIGEVAKENDIQYLLEVMKCYLESLPTEESGDE
ncbi:uncharacterized protein ISCGN_021151 [Ixodes scapularis]